MYKSCQIINLFIIIKIRNFKQYYFGVSNIKKLIEYFIIKNLEIIKINIKT